MTKKTDYVPAPDLPAELIDRYRTLMEASLGVITVTEAARRLRLSRVRAQTLLHRGESAFIEAISPHEAGRPSKPESERKLSEENARLRREVKSLSSRVETIDRLFGAASDILTGRVRLQSPKEGRTKSKKVETEVGPAEEPDPIAQRAAGAMILLKLGMPPNLVARIVGVSRSTLRRLLGGKRKVRTPRRRAKLSAEVALKVEAVVRDTHGLIGAASIIHEIAGASRRQAAELKEEVLTRMERERKAEAQRVTYTQPGVARGFDQFYGELAVILVCVDAASPYRTSFFVAPNYSTEQVARAIELDIEKNGAPLVWRMDRASCHRTPLIDAIFSKHGILRLHGPARHPGYYGQLERTNRDNRAWLRMVPPAQRDRPEQFEALRVALNERWPRASLGFKTPAEIWAKRPQIGDDRQMLREEVRERAQRFEREGMKQDLAERLAIETALKLRGYLRIERREAC